MFDIVKGHSSELMRAVVDMVDMIALNCYKTWCDIGDYQAKRYVRLEPGNKGEFDLCFIQISSSSKFCGNHMLIPKTPHHDHSRCSMRSLCESVCFSWRQSFCDQSLAGRSAFQGVLRKLRDT